MKPALALILLLITSAFGFAQDLELRSRAVALVEKANAVSLSPNLPNLERVDTFRVFDPSSTAREGSFSRVVVQGVGRREETTFGDYSAVNVWTGNTHATTHPNGLAPSEVATVMHLTPIHLLRLDEADLIHAIIERVVDGRAAHCIEFDTVVGQRREENELCVDALNATFVSEKLGDDLIENSNFFSFAGALFPAKITYSVLSSGPKLEINQTMTTLGEATGNVLASPPDAETLRLCTTVRRAIGQTTPQPPPGNGGRDEDVVVRGIIGPDGKVHSELIQSSERPDLNPEALTLVGQWVFLPPMCDGRPGQSEASFVVHFHGR